MKRLGLNRKRVGSRWIGIFALFFCFVQCTSFAQNLTDVQQSAVNAFAANLKNVMIHGNDMQRFEALFVDEPSAAFMVEQYKVARPKMTDEEAAFAKQTILNQKQVAREYFNTWHGQYTGCELTDVAVANELNVEWYQLQFNVNIANESGHIKVIAVNVNGQLKMLGKP